MNARVKEIRKKLEMTQQEFAKALNVSSNYIYLIESGNKPVSDKFIFTLCNVFKVNKDWLFNGTGDIFLSSDLDNELVELTASLLSPEMDEHTREQLIQLTKMYSRMNDKERELIMEIANKMAGK